MHPEPKYQKQLIKYTKHVGRKIKMVRGHNSVDFLLLDVIMPNSNGAEAFEKIKALKPDIKTLFMSGYPSDILENHGFDDQAIEFIMKPLNPIGLLRKIRSILG